MSRAVSITFLLITATTASAQPNVASGPPPTFTVVREAHPAKGHLVLIFTRSVVEMAPYSEKVEFNGQIKEVVRYMARYTHRHENVTYDLTKSKVIAPDGKQLPIDEAWKRLKVNSVVAVAFGVNPPGPAFLRALNPETLVIIPGPVVNVPDPK